MPPPVEIGLTDLPKSGGGARAPPAPSLVMGFHKDLNVTIVHQLDQVQVNN